MVTRTYCDRCASQTSIGQVTLRFESPSAGYAVGGVTRDLCLQCTHQLDDLVKKFVANPPENSQ